MKKSFHAKFRYGQQKVDFDEGIMLFVAPMQVISVEPPAQAESSHKGWLLLVDPDLLGKTGLAARIRQYEYFSYNANEALHLSDKEEGMIVGIMKNIMEEYQARTDDFSQDVIIAQLELLFTYAERFYQRQFITRKVSSHHVVNQLEELQHQYFKSDQLQSAGIPSVAYFADALHLSPNYLSRLLKTLTGQSTKQFIIDKVIGLAKEKLSTTELTMNEIAYALGFEHPQSFSKLLKVKRICLRWSSGNLLISQIITY
jgi:AraC-like DNA-binding protein